MSLLTTSDGRPVLEQWTDDILPFIQRLHPDVEVSGGSQQITETLSRRHVPADIERLAMWATVQDDPAIGDSHRRKVLTYVYTISHDLGPLPSHRRVGVLLHGFVKSVNVTTFGDWRGCVSLFHSCALVANKCREASMTKMAGHHVTLYAGGRRNIWEKTTTPLNNFVNFSSLVLGIPVEGIRPVFGRTVSLHHRVFEKVITSAAGADAASDPFALDDPYNLHDRIPTGWRLATQPALLAAGPVGSTSPLPHMLLAKGDFVEVAATFDLVVASNPSRRRTLKVFLSFTRITRIAKASDVERPVRGFFRVYDGMSNTQLLEADGYKTQYVFHV
ncbi:hypothetical protein CONPUDRAFT_145654 [Coniophora puteana RWD-64-598 SS2]|uniref:Uncharacterized protein n=1 Tax=Coniophora puteana (strain RWD-64-598) TaxID=741705 RepID=A0A5M3MHJ2_CONPW|nr:uncharacterized protein CONPUDRAFT_145654 [Coniophora puteana RWD-64-598 SS2]EIW78410.1 hypothetical protein CONPUDRAFT_145654 [Coniophora puteana RWD-64-598 SS2]